jgi:hypothetical protein
MVVCQGDVFWADLQRSKEKNARYHEPYHLGFGTR